MKKKKQCEFHLKVYSLRRATLKTHPWICSLCGEEGIDEGDAYDVIKKKFENEKT